MEPDCLFCRISRKEIPAKIVHEDDVAVAFEDISPKAPVHILVIPRKHIPTIAELGSEDGPTLGHLIQVARELAAVRGISESGYRLVLNCRGDAGQEVFHIHLHLLGGRKMSWPPG